jgi:hypothetical protein
MPSDLVSVNAFVCERILEERDGTLTAIRIVDNVQFPAGTTPTADLYVVVIAKSQSHAIDRKLHVALETPSGKKTAVSENQTIVFGPEDTPTLLKGTQVVIKLTMKASEAGVYWLHVNIDQEFATKVPITFTPLPQSESSAPSQQPGS